MAAPALVCASSAVMRNCETDMGRRDTSEIQPLIICATPRPWQFARVMRSHGIVRPHGGDPRHGCPRSTHHEAHRPTPMPHRASPRAATVRSAAQQERLNADAEGIHAEHADGAWGRRAASQQTSHNRTPGSPRRCVCSCPIRVFSVHPPASASNLACLAASRSMLPVRARTSLRVG